MSNHEWISKNLRLFDCYVNKENVEEKLKELNEFLNNAKSTNFEYSYMKHVEGDGNRFREENYIFRPNGTFHGNMTEYAQDSGDGYQYFGIYRIEGSIIELNYFLFNYYGSFVEQNLKDSKDLSLIESKEFLNLKRY